MEALLRPSLALITMLEYVPTLLAVGMPDSCPVVLTKVAHGGWFVMEKTSVRPWESVALGANE